MKISQTVAARELPSCPRGPGMNLACVLLSLRFIEKHPYLLAQAPASSDGKENEAVTRIP